MTQQFTCMVCHIIGIDKIIQRKERDRLQREKEILDAAESLLIEKGYDAMTMDEVAKRADFTKRTIYAYFTGKKDLYAAIVARALSHLNGLFEKAVELPGTELDKIASTGFDSSWNHERKSERRQQRHE
jgi:AcrR family transcriptional regulator